MPKKVTKYDEIWRRY